MLDLYCCAGGASKGYQRAGFRVVGVDKVARPNYCGDQFWKRDALKFLRSLIATPWGLSQFVLIHASPPCQKACTLTTGTNQANGWGRDHEQLVPATRALLDRTGLPYVVEQPAGHGGLIRRDLMLCMDMFPIGEPPWVQRHRDFEFGNWPDLRMSGGPESLPTQLKHPGHRGYVRGMRHGVYRDGPYVAAYGSGGGKATVPEMQHALGIDWTDVREELTEAIPPAYTEHIGRAFLNGRSMQPAPETIKASDLPWDVPA